MRSGRGHVYTQKEAQYCNIYKRSESSSEGETEKGGVGEGRRKVYIGHKSNTHGILSCTKWKEPASSLQGQTEGEQTKQSADGDISITFIIPLYHLADCKVNESERYRHLVCFARIGKNFIME
jgi:hypothetical protein